MTDQEAFGWYMEQPGDGTAEEAWHAALAYLRSRQEPVQLIHAAVSEDGCLRWMTGRKLQNCELYAMPDGKRAPVLYLTPQPAIPDGWLRVIDEEMVATRLGVAEPSDDYATARRKLFELINWHVQVAIDPTVNGGWKLVPVEPTQEMLETGEIITTTLYNDFGSNEHVEIGANSAEAAYHAMLAAAPEYKK